MKKRALAAVLTFAMALTFLPARAAAYSTHYTREEAEEQFGVSISTPHLDLGTFYQGETSETKKITITNTGSRRFNVFGVSRKQRDVPATIRYNSSNAWLDPGESYDLEVYVSYSSLQPGSYSVDLEFDIAFSHAAVINGVVFGSESGFTIDDACTVSYEVLSPSDTKGALSIKTSVDSLDFGTLEYDRRGQEEAIQTLTITNVGDLTCDLSYDTDSGFYIKDDSDRDLEPGEKTTLTVRIPTDKVYSTGPMETYVDIVATYGSGSAYEAEQRIHIPVVVKFLVNAENGGGGSYKLWYSGDNTYGSVYLEDGSKIKKSEGALDFIELPEYGSLTVNIKPYSKYSYLADVKIDEESVGPVSSYTFENVQADHDIVTVFRAGSQPSEWAVEPIERAYSYGLMSYELTKYFSYSRATDTYSAKASFKYYTLAAERQDFCMLGDALYTRVTGEHPSFLDVNFTDLSGPAIESTPIRRMAALGVVTGVGDGSFNPRGTLTREAAATMLARLADAVGHPLPSAAPDFADSDAISSWAYDAVGQVQAAGIMSGTGDGMFSPQAEYSLEQCVVTAVRMFEYIQGE